MWEVCFLLTSTQRGIFSVNSEPTCLPRICISLAGPLPGWMYQVCSIVRSASHSTVCTLCLLPFANLTSEGGPVPEYWSLFVSVQLSGWPVNLLCFAFVIFFFFYRCFTQSSSCLLADRDLPLIPLLCSMKGAHFVNAGTICMLFPRTSGNMMGPSSKKTEKLVIHKHLLLFPNRLIISAVFKCQVIS